MINNNNVAANGIMKASVIMKINGNNDMQSCKLSMAYQAAGNNGSNKASNGWRTKWRNNGGVANN